VIKIVPIRPAAPGHASREEIFDDESQKVLGSISTFETDGPFATYMRGGVEPLYAAYAMTPVDDEHKNGKHVVCGVEGRQAAIDLVVMMHRYWTLPAFEKEQS